MNFFIQVKKALCAENTSDERGYNISQTVRLFFSRLNEQTNLIVDELMSGLPGDLYCTRIAEVVKGIAYPAVDVIIEGILKRGIDDSPETEDFTKEDIVGLFLQVRDEVAKFYYQTFVHDPSSILSQVVGNAFVNDNLSVKPDLTQHAADIINHLFTELCIVIGKKVVRRISEKVVLQRDESNHTLLHLACLHKKDRELLAILEHGLTGKIIPESLLEELESIAAKPGYGVIANVLSGFFASSTQKKRSASSLLSMMGVMRSPAERIAVVSKNGTPYGTNILSRKLDGILRPITRHSLDGVSADTPCGSRMYSVWNIQVINNGKMNFVSVLVDSRKSMDFVARPVREAKSVSKSLPVNTKKPFVVTINKKTLELWRKWKASTRNKRYRSQADAMAGFSAKELAELAGFDGLFHLCHESAYSFGGPDGKIPLPEEFDLVGPQQEKNLIVGTVEANGHMGIIEHEVRHLIEHHNFDELTLCFTPYFYDGLEAFHIGDRLEYTIQDLPVNPTRSVTIPINMLTRRKVSDEEVTAVVATIVHQFIVELEIDLTPRPLSFDESNGDDTDEVEVAEGMASKKRKSLLSPPAGDRLSFLMDQRAKEDCDPQSPTCGYKRSPSGMSSYPLS